MPNPSKRSKRRAVLADIIPGPAHYILDPNYRLYLHAYWCWFKHQPKPRRRYDSPPRVACAEDFVSGLWFNRPDIAVIHWHLRMCEEA